MPSSFFAIHLRTRALSTACRSAVIAGAFSLCACSVVNWHPDFQWVYKIDIQQGSVVTQEMVAQLHPGLTRDQVRFIMGSPPLTDVFHANRWDYPYRFQPGRGTVVLRRFTVYFESDRLSRFEGDPVPTEKEFVESRMRLMGKTNPANLPSPEVMPSPGVDATLKGPGGSGTNAAGGTPTVPSTKTTPTPSSDDSGPTLWDRIKSVFGGTPDQSNAPQPK